MFTKNNPYELMEELDRGTDRRFFVEFRDGVGVYQKVEVSEEVFFEFQEFQRENWRLDRSDYTHKAKQELTEESFPVSRISIEDILTEKEEQRHIQSAIDKLPKIQRRRLILYYFQGFTYEEIAKIEGCSLQASNQSFRCCCKK